MTLAWAAAGFGLPHDAESYVAACVVPVLALPLILRVAVALRQAVSQTAKRRTT